MTFNRSIQLIINDISAILGRFLKCDYSKLSAKVLRTDLFLWQPYNENVSQEELDLQEVIKQYALVEQQLLDSLPNAFLEERKKLQKIKEDITECVGYLLFLSHDEVKLGSDRALCEYLESLKEQTKQQEKDRTKLEWKQKTSINEKYRENFTNVMKKLDNFLYLAMQPKLEKILVNLQEIRDNHLNHVTHKGINQGSLDNTYDFLSKDCLLELIGWLKEVDFVAQANNACVAARAISADTLEANQQFNELVSQIIATAASVKQKVDLRMKQLQLSLLA